MSNSYDWENNKKIYKKSSLLDFLGKEVVLQKVANREAATWAASVLKVQYRSSHFWIIWKTLSLDYRPEGERIILKSKNLQIIDMNQTKTGVDTLTKFGKLL